MLRVTLFLLVAALLPGEERIDTDTYAKIRTEAREHSQVMQTLHMLTDRYGPRLTGSPNYDAAAKWAAAKMTEWGLKNAHLEPWEFGHPGWSNERADGHMLAPVTENLKFEVLAWTPSTKGTVSGQAVLLVLPEKPTKEDLAKWVDENKDKVRGKMVLVGKSQVVPVSFSALRKRLEDKDVKARLEGGGPGPMGPRQPQAPPDPNRPSSNQITAEIDTMLVANGALVRLNDAGREHGQIRAFQNRTYDVTKAPPTVILRNEDYGRIARLLGDGEKVELEFNIVNKLHPQGTTTYNVIAEIPGSDKADEVVMLGGHLDSWHAATGATDNATGVSATMEAVRVIAALGLKPRRTIRIGLWAAEEQGLLGSQAYVKQHFGSFEDPKPDYPKLAGYFNIDSGTGRVRSASVFGPADAATVLREALAPFEDLGVMGAAATAGRRLGGTDSTSFNAAGLAGIGLSQDPIEYMSATWHTNLDTYERAVPEDLVKSATVIAAGVWHLANRDELLPRFPKEKMPEAPKPAPQQ